MQKTFPKFPQQMIETLKDMTVKNSEISILVYRWRFKCNAINHIGSPAAAEEKGQRFTDY